MRQSFTPLSMLQPLLYVNPELGDDENSGSAHAPLKTISTAIKRSTSDCVIHLASGHYTRKGGELFPLILPSGVQLIGDIASQGDGVIIRGSGIYNSDRLKAQNVAIAMAPDSALKGVTVINLERKSTGVWIEAGRVEIENNCFQHCRREAIFAAGTSKALIFDNLFLDNKGNAIFMANNAKGEICHNQFQGNQYAIALNESAAPFIAHNRIAQNQVGVFIAKQTRPVLRRNIIELNQEFGIVISGNAQPDLGLTQDPAGNIIRQNMEADLRNKTDEVVISVGNDLNPVTTAGMVEFAAAAVPVTKMGMTPFRDVLSHWAEPFIQVLVENDYLQGFPDGTFRPDAPLTRAEYAALLARCFDLPRPLGAQDAEFEDIDDGFWGKGAIAKAVTMGFLIGYPDDTFRPQAPLTRLQAIISLAKGLGLKGGNPKVLQAYGDRPLIPSYALNAVAAATQNSLIVNYPKQSRLQPLHDITRGEMAALLHQALVVNQKLPRLHSEHIVDPLPYLPTFSDVTFHWARPFITAIANLGLVQGYEDGSFHPDALLKRAEFASLLSDIFAPPPVRPASIFFDVPSDFWAANAIQQVYRGGFVSGFPDQTFHPHQGLRRVHVILALANGLNLPSAKIDESLNYYLDADEIPDYARQAVAAATQANLIVNYPDPKILNPNDEATRAEAIALCYQALVYLDQATEIASSAIVRFISALSD
ncbi:S-layer homology domain-containing protein [[Limnothrix rosea] IAM M-220]|uniref:S-layer homology domain-containing protein n=1 Tax=[Limnothrix rosea] IAM M-220 TaxID=454133 RepID=UPI000A0159A4|nr:S-layer homology domain-containing protein [[Limnothrix rosea] IAM M-220]